MNVRFRKHGVVLQFGLSQWRSIASDDDELGLAASQTLEGRLVAESDFAGFHHERQARTNLFVSFVESTGLSGILDGVLGLLCLLGSHRCAVNLCWTLSIGALRSLKLENEDCESVGFEYMVRLAEQTNTVRA